MAAAYAGGSGEDLCRAMLDRCLPSAGIDNHAMLIAERDDMLRANHTPARAKPDGDARASCCTRVTLIQMRERFDGAEHTAVLRPVCSSGFAACPRPCPPVRPPNQPEEPAVVARRRCEIQAVEQRCAGGGRIDRTAQRRTRWRPALLNPPSAAAAASEPVSRVSAKRRCCRRSPRKMKVKNAERGRRRWWR